MAPPSHYGQSHVVALGLAEMLLDGSSFRVARVLTATVLRSARLLPSTPWIPKAFLIGESDVAVSATSAATNLPSSLPLFGIGIDGY